MAVKLLVTGANGRLGRALTAARPEAVALTRRDLDITDASAVRAALRTHRPDVVVNAAAWTAVDDAELDEPAAHAVNAVGAGHLAREAADVGAAIVHVSTDYVFSGAGPHLPDAACAPCNAYGRTKLAGEVAVRAHPRHVILRTSWLFCEHGPSFPRAIVRRAVRSAPLRVVDDQQGGPTPTSGLARGVLAVVDQLDDDPWGTWHCAGRPHTTWHGFAVALVEALGMPADAVERVSSTRFPRAATRPADSRLDVSAFEARFGMCVDWREGLGALVERLR